MKKKAILLVSVGTSELTALNNTTVRMLEQVKERFPEYYCNMAFSSEHILAKMNVKSETPFLSVSEALEEHLRNGVEEVFIQPTNLLNGLETDGMLEQLEEYKGKFQVFKIGRPLFSSKEDYIKTLQAILDQVNPKEDEALVLIGHGSNHLAGSAYQNLEYTAYTNGYRQVLVGTVEGGKSQNMTLRKLSLSGLKKVRLMPLLFVAGYHAKKDIAAEDGSWKCVLEDAGYEVVPHLVGLGEIDGIRELFIRHLQEVMEEA